MNCLCCGKPITDKSSELLDMIEVSYLSDELKVSMIDLLIDRINDIMSKSS